MAEPPSAKRRSALGPGVKATLDVVIFDYPAGDLTNVHVSMRGFSKRFWVPTELLKACEPPR